MRINRNALVNLDEDVIALFQGSFDELRAGVAALAVKLVTHQTDLDTETRIEWAMATRRMAEALAEMACSRDECPHLSTETVDLDRICAQHAQEARA